MRNGIGGGCELIRAEDVANIVYAPYRGLLIKVDNVKRIVNAEGNSLRVIPYQVERADGRRYGWCVWGLSTESAGNEEYDNYEDANASMLEGWQPLMREAVEKGAVLFASCW